MIGIDTAELRCHLSYSTHSSSFLKPGAYITQNATKQLSDITGGNYADS